MHREQLAAQAGEHAKPPGLTDVVSIAAGTNLTIALKEDGTVVAWGDSSYGRTSVPPEIRARAVFAGGHRTWLLLDTTFSTGLRTRVAIRPAFTPGHVRIRRTAGRLVWEGQLASLPHLPREIATRQLLFVEESASRHVHVLP